MLKIKQLMASFTQFIKVMGTVEDKIVSINTLYCCKTVIYIKTPFNGVDKDPISTLRLILIRHVYIFKRSLIK